MAVGGDRSLLRDRNAPEVKLAYSHDDGYWFGAFSAFTSSHPPLYYLLAAALQGLLEGETVFVRLLAVRWLSVLFGVSVAALAYRAGRLIFQNDAWALLLATLVSFQPMITFLMSIANNGSMEIAMFSVCLVMILAILLSGLSLRRAWLLGIGLGAGFLTRISLVSLIPLVALVCVGDGVRLARTRGSGSREWTRWGWVVAIPLAVAGWWYGQWFPGHAPGAVVSDPGGPGSGAGRTCRPFSEPIGFAWRGG